MPGRNGTGPTGAGAGTGRRQAGPGGRGRMGGTKAGAGPAGNCVCPSCGKIVAHQRAVPCYNLVCPDCGAKMVRE